MMRPAQLLIPALLLCASSPNAPQTVTSQQRGAAETQQRVRLVPQLVPGRVFRYQMDFRTITEGRRTGLVEDPQAPSQLEISWSAVARVEVLNAEPVSSPPALASSAPSTVGRARLRTAYENVAATARSDTFDPEAAAIAEHYRNLEGHAITFTLGADGKLGKVEGLQEIVDDARTADVARDWLAQFAVGASAPAEGIIPAQTWSSESPVTSAPIAGLLWRTESTYLRDERCRPLTDSATPENPSPSETCAVILTRFEIAQPRPLRDSTPEDYRKRGLRAAGKWNGSGEALTYVSLQTGWVVSITQSGTEEMDFSISTADGASRVHYAGRVRSQSQITLLPDSTAPR